MKNINIQGSTLIEIIITLVIIMFVVMGLFTQQLKAIWVFNVSLEKEVMSSMLQNGFESYLLSIDLKEIQLSGKTFHFIHSDASLILTYPQALEYKDIYLELTTDGGRNQ